VLPISRGAGPPPARGPNRTGTHGVVGTNPARLQRRCRNAKSMTGLLKLQDEPYARFDAFVKEMFATPAHTPEGRRAKTIVLLSCILGDEWSRVDEKTEHRELMARNLLIEFVGGEPGEQLRDQFA
jgi:hypothetical protein